jgi:hypothetical protein
MSMTRRSALAMLGMAGVSLPALLHGQPVSLRHKGVQQPHMRAALEALQAAKHHLDAAEADKGGHRAKAIGLVNDAIKEVEQGIAVGATH